MRARSRRSRLHPSPRVENGTRRLQLENLEQRCVLSSDCLSLIAGTVSRDANANGIFDPGEQLADVAVELYRDDGDGQFTVADQLEDQTTTDVTGRYRFIDLASASYFVVQPPQTVGDIELQALVSPLITLTTETAVVIDPFTTPSEPITANAQFPSASGGNSAPDAIGDFREFAVSYFGEDNGFASAVVSDGLFQIDAAPAGATSYLLTWDGSLDGLDFNGLDGVDLTGGLPNAGVLISGLVLEEDTQFELTLYTDESLLSQIEVTQPATAVPTDLFIPFSFVQGSADVTNSGAIQLAVDPAQPAASGQIDRILTIGGEAADFDFFNELSSSVDIEKLTNGVQADDPGDAVEIVVGEQVTWNYLVTNTGETDLFSIEVTDDQVGDITDIISQGDPAAG